MPLYETESFVLKSYDLADADRIVVFFTREHGIVRGVAKGVKRLKSRFGALLEPFSVVDLTFFHKEDRELVNIQSVELVRSSFEAASELAYLSTFSYIAELLSTFAPPNDPNEKLYRMVKAVSEIKASNERELAAVRAYFELWLLRLGGYWPELKACAACGREISDTEETMTDSSFRIFCCNCRQVKGNRTLSPEIRRLFGDIQARSPNDFVTACPATQVVLAEASAIMQRMLEAAAGRTIRVPQFAGDRSHTR
ncbi:MAG: DNA repair protein RecO [Blastocatellia bacterium]|nr:DNA repair protein RecO [Blastocatellia bacterium]